MADSVAIAGAHQKAQAHARLACRLRLKEVIGVRGPLKAAGELELENLSRDVIEITYQMSPLQYLELLVAGPCGTVVSEGHFGDRFSPMREERILRLQPAEKFISQVPLLGTVPPEKRSPGVYRVQAVYAYDGIRAVSDPIEVTVE